MKIEINNSFYISDILPSDKEAYLEHLQEKQIYLQTCAIPYPYTPADADYWIQYNIEWAKKQGGRAVNWAIRRRSDGYLVGTIGFHNHEIGKSHCAEIGYWLAKPYWGQGIMTEAVKAATDYGFKELGLERITAHVFDFNLGSCKVLEKAGYQCEGYLRSHYRKDDKIFDGKLYAVLRSDYMKADDYGVRAPESLQRPDFIKHFLEIQNTDDARYPDSPELLSIGSPFAKRLGLKRLGIHHEVLPPGRRTSWPHAESHEEEFVYVIEGSPDVWIDGRLHRLRAGDGVGFPAGTGICHTVINNTDATVRLLVVGEANKKENKCVYALHPERNQAIKEQNFLWEDAPARELGGHDGLPDKLRKN